MISKAEATKRVASFTIGFSDRIAQILYSSALNGTLGGVFPYGPAKSSDVDKAVTDLTAAGWTIVRDDAVSFSLTVS